ncbi:MAG: hypothetical protein EXR72_04200 [Myxococcales bacterium]|nr:hypothetical protein [Myxococcales bacterium]
MSRHLPFLFLLALVAVARPAAAQNAPAGSGPVGADASALRFYGFGADLYSWDSNSLNRYSYSNQLSMGITPRWSVGRLIAPKSRFGSFTISARFIMNRSFAGYDPSQFHANSDQGPAVPCSDLTPSAQGGKIDPNQVQRCQTGHDQSSYRWDFSDIWLTFSNPRLITIPVLKININPNALMILPSSKQSQYEGLKLGLIGTIGTNRVFLEGKIVLGYSFGVRKNFHDSTRPLADTGYSGPTAENLQIVQGSRQFSPQDLSDNTFTLNGLGGNSQNYQLRHFFSVGGGWKALSYSVLYIITNATQYDISCESTVNGQGHNLCDAGNAVGGYSGSGVTTAGKRDNHIFWVNLGYDVTDWLNLNLSYVNASPMRKADNSLRQPFISTNYDAFTSISVGFNISIDTVAEKLSPLPVPKKVASR